MDNNNLPDIDELKGGKMTQRSIQVQLDLWNRARLKVGTFGSLSKEIRKFLYYWLKGDIDLDKFPDIEE